MLNSWRKMGNSNVGQLKGTRFDEALHSSIMELLLSDGPASRPVFTQLYLEAGGLHHQQEAESEDKEGEEDECFTLKTPSIPRHLKPSPEGHCTTDGFCQSGKDLRLASISTSSLDTPAGFLLVGVKSPVLLDDTLVCAVDRRFIPDETGQNALLGFLGNCVGCGRGGFRYFTEFSIHINLKPSGQPMKQKYLQCHLHRDACGRLVTGPPICWRTAGRMMGCCPVVGHRRDPTALQQSSQFSPSLRDPDLSKPSVPARLIAPHPPTLII
uniref:Protein GREB1-like n=1 Tax=Paramormyrops kingsleyae TaxID=1676925 RepID=A0A3B3RM41_9TELE